jgi:hypothetical protein
MYGDCLALASLDGHNPVGGSARLGLAVHPWTGSTASWTISRA